MSLLPSAKAAHVFDLEPRHAWHASLVRQLFRFRSIFTLVGVQGGAACLAFIKQQPSIASALAGMMLVSIPALLGLRTLFVRNIRCEQSLHDLVHELRDHSSSILSCRDSAARKALIKSFHQVAAERIAQIFRTKLGCLGATCCIRMLDIDETDGKKKYITSGRSRNMNVNRADSSEPLSPESGIAKALADKKFGGCYIIPDVERAVDDGFWVRQQNDRLRDVRSWIACPVNGWVDGSKSNLAILFVGSHRSGLFSKLYPGLCFELQAIADLLGTMYPLFFDVSERLARPRQLSIGTEHGSDTLKAPTSTADVEAVQDNDQ